MALIRKKIFITGRVQGVGFRPAVYRLANQFGLVGFCLNDTKGVTIELQGQDAKIALFLSHLQSTDTPPLAKIVSCQATDISVVDGEQDFLIKQSNSDGLSLSQVTIDTGVCQDCLNEMDNPNDFRFSYPFINCTNCGPRYSIIKTIPYDRPNTTMSSFGMCDKCQSQYKNPANRRFHAQPIACPQCGPKIWLTNTNGQTIQTETEKVIADSAKLLKNGKIVAIKGLGGFHLAVDALNEQAVRTLRERKNRDHKPFALMADSIKTIKQYANVNKLSERILKSPQSPIVLLPKLKNTSIAESVARQTNTLGFMLCYTPLHFLLFAQNDIDVLVMTSGNISDEPLICENDQAIEKLSKVADAFLMHDRTIYRQLDDSIVHLIDEKPVLLRRSRGYVPTPIITDKICPEDIFAAGGDLKNTFCFVKQNQIICSEHIGDLKDAKVFRHYTDSVRHLGGLFELEPKIIACDLHPGYLSTQFALSKPGTRKIQIQHHWSHIASVLAEHNIDETVIGLCCDGTGYGTDGTIWGCECLIASMDKFERFGHLDYYNLTGSDKAAKEAIRPTLGILYQTHKNDLKSGNFDWLIDRIESDIEKRAVIIEQIEKQINCVATSSLGRLFDAVAAMLSLGNYNHFEAQLPMAMEAIIEKNIKENYDFELSFADGQLLIGLQQMFGQLISDIQQKKPASMISAKFHNTIAAFLLETAKNAKQQTNLNTVALSGGVFCNRYLTNRLVKSLKKNDFRVLFNRLVPSNDGGISVGQAAIAVNQFYKNG